MSSSRRPTKNEKRRQKKKDNKLTNGESDRHSEAENGKLEPKKNYDRMDDESIEIEYVSASYDGDQSLDSSIMQQFQNVFSKFSKPEELLSTQPIKPSDSANGVDNALSATEESKASEEELERANLSKRKKKLLNRLSVAELKQLVNRPDVVEAHDVASSNPRLLVHLKAYRNTVPVPRHWCQIRKYLQGKRGIEKIPFQLPEFIAETGIAKIRDSIMEQEALRKSKQKARERMRPKMGRIDIDYQVLHDAFFKFQTKPKLSGHGDLYYEGREFEVQLKEKKPGILSQELIAALGIQEGAPPPWLINMQRYGPPPSYTHLRIPGLNAPLPPGAAYGYHPGGWGKPPVDEYSRPLYGDVFGTAVVADLDAIQAVDKSFRWGAYEFEEEEVEEEEDEEEEEKEDVPSDRRTWRSNDLTGLETPSVNEHTLISGLETPDTFVDLRKRAGTETPESSIGGYGGGGNQRDLYQVLQEKKVNGIGGQLFASDRTYHLSGRGETAADAIAGSSSSSQKLSGNGGYDSSAALSQNEALLRHVSNHGGGGDGIETEEDNLRGSKKRKAETTGASAASRKAKEFKF